MRLGLLAGSLACLAASAAMAESAISISKAVFVERAQRSASGATMRAIEPASELRKGDKVVLVIEWRAGSDADSFSVSSAVPRTLAFQRAGTDHVEISVDGGRNWGQLGTMRTRDQDGTRLASPEDVTHLRWRVADSEASRGRGRFTYSALVR